jgi:hypothetical protein
MHVLVTEASFGDSDDMVRRLRDIGCQVSTCHGSAGICRATLGGPCPLDGPVPVDMIVDVRSAGEELTAREFGAVCAIRSKAPLVIVDADPERIPVVPAGLEQLATAVRGSALLWACVDGMRAAETVGSS